MRTSSYVDYLDDDDAARALMMGKTVFASQLGLGLATWRSQVSNLIIISHLSISKRPSFVFRLNVANVGSGHACLISCRSRVRVQYPTLNVGILSLESAHASQLCSFWIEGVFHQDPRPQTDKTSLPSSLSTCLHNLLQRSQSYTYTFAAKKMKVSITKGIAIGLAVRRSHAISLSHRGFLSSCDKATCGALAHKSVLPLRSAVQDGLKEQALFAACLSSLVVHKTQENTRRASLNTLRGMPRKFE